MGDLGRGALLGTDRRRALRVPVRGAAVVHAKDGALHATIENLSSTGVLVSSSNVPPDEPFDVELKLGNGTRRIRAKAVRIEPGAPRLDEVRAPWRIALRFDHVEATTRDAIVSAIEQALHAASRRPILVMDDRAAHRDELATRLAARGLMPLAPRTPLEAIDLLARNQLYVGVCLLAPSFGHSLDQLRGLVSESFPWVTTAEISEDVDATVDRAVAAWSGTDMARVADGTA